MRGLFLCYGVAMIRPGQRKTGVVCATCGDVYRELSWIQPCLEEGIGDSVAFVERGCLCGWVAIGVNEIPADKMRMVEAAYEVEQSFINPSSELLNTWRNFLDRSSE